MPRLTRKTVLEHAVSQHAVPQQAVSKQILSEQPVSKHTVTKHTVGRVPALRWGRIFTLAIVVFATSLGGVEAYWRYQGFSPSIADREDLWYFWRQRVYSADGRTIVLLGTSRMQADVSPTILERELGMRVVQLAVRGKTSPIGILRDLSEDPRFDGLVLCSLFVPLVHRSRWGDADDFRTYRPRSVPAYVDSLLASRLRSKLTALHAKLSLASLAERAFNTGQLRPMVPVYSFSFERSLRMWPVAAEANPDIEQRRLHREFFSDTRIPGFDELLGACDDIESFVRRIRSRGGDVAFVDLPSSGEQLADEEKAFPKQQYWDRFARRISAPCLHFRDCQSLRGFSCPDGVHLSEHDAPRFTESLAEELKRAGFGRRVANPESS